MMTRGMNRLLCMMVVVIVPSCVLQYSSVVVVMVARFGRMGRNRVCVVVMCIVEKYVLSTVRMLGAVMICMVGHQVCGVTGVNDCVLVKIVAAGTVLVQVVTHGAAVAMCAVTQAVSLVLCYIGQY